MPIVLDLVDLSIGEMDHALGVFGGDRIVCHHDDGHALLVQGAQEVQDLAPGVTVEVAGRFIGDDQDRIVDQRPRDRHALLLSTGEFLRLVMNTVCQTDHFQHLERFFLAFFIAEMTVAVIEQGHHHVPQGAGARQQVVGLEDKSQLLVADERQFLFAHVADILPIEDVLSRGGARETAQDVHERAFA